jgi:multimeric flavodoxin WrbA
VNKTINALFLNCTLKSSPIKSNTEGLMKEAIEIMQREGIQTEMTRPIDLDLHHSVDPVLDQDDWPGLFNKIRHSNILVIGSPVWLGEKSSVAAKLFERLYAHRKETNQKGQYIYYNKVGGTIITGNEDGGKHVARDVLYALSHLGFTIPPQADCYWVGEAGPGPSYSEAGEDNEFTKRNLRIMSWNLIQYARQLM